MSDVITRTAVAKLHSSYVRGLLTFGEYVDTLADLATEPNVVAEQHALEDAALEQVARVQQRARESLIS